MNAEFYQVAIWSVLLLWVDSANALQIHRTGSLKDVKTRTSFQICMAGGGSDDLWSEGWRLLLHKSGGGDVVVIREDGKRGGYERWLYHDLNQHGFPKINSVTTLIIESRNDAEAIEALEALKNAELVFFAGGDQSHYIDFFKGSKIEKILKQLLLTKKTPIGGTSAGMAVLAGIDYTGRYASPKNPQSWVTSNDVLSSPMAPFVDLDPHFLVPPFMKNVITETHLSQRKRHGRLLGFMQKAQSIKSLSRKPQQIKGIGGDEGTAFCYNEQGKGIVYGSGEMVFVSLQGATKAYHISGKMKGAQFDLKKWKGRGGYVTSWVIEKNESDESHVIQQ